MAEEVPEEVVVTRRGTPTWGTPAAAARILAAAESILEAVEIREASGAYLCVNQPVKTASR